jgi:ribosome-associated protein
MTLKKSRELLVAALEDMKAQDIKVLDVRKLTSIADLMIIASGRSNRQVRAIADKVAETAKANKMDVLGMEGQQEGEWILVDLGDIIVHVMQPLTRDYYQLEKLWTPPPKKASVSSS